MMITVAVVRVVASHLSDRRLADRPWQSVRLGAPILHMHMAHPLVTR